MVWGGCLAIAIAVISFVLLLPGIWVGIGYGYDLGDWLSLLVFPADAEENGWWLVRIVLFGSLLASTAFLAIVTVRDLLKRHSPP